MAVYHLNSANGSPTDPYDTWTKAANTLAQILAATPAPSAGDTIYVDPSHSETAWATATLPNTKATPWKMLCGTHSGASGIDALSTGGRIATTSTQIGTINGCGYIYGVVFACPSGATGDMRFGNADGSVLMLENCSILHEGSTGSDISIGHTSSIQAMTTLKNCTVRLNNTGSQVRVQQRVRVFGGGLHASTAANNANIFVIGTAACGTDLEVYGFDFSNGGNSMGVVGLGTTSVVSRAIFRNCKMPSGWTAGTTSFLAATPGPNCYASLLNYGQGDTNYKFWYESHFGTVKHFAQGETNAVYADSGASDGAVGYSWIMASSANVAFPSTVFRSPPLIERVTASATPKDVSVDFVHDGASAFTDIAVWLEVEYLGTSGFPLATFASDRGTAIGTPAAQTAGLYTWTGDNGTGPNGTGTWHQLRAHVTGLVFEETGYVRATICMGIASKTIYVNPMLDISASE